MDGFVMLSADMQHYSLSHLGIGVGFVSRGIGELNVDDSSLLGSYFLTRCMARLVVMNAHQSLKICVLFGVYCSK
jgi:hypothetical protein